MIFFGRGEVATRAEIDSLYLRDSSSHNPTPSFFNYQFLIFGFQGYDQPHNEGFLSLTNERM